MIIHPAEQRTEAWFKARIGVVTASQFHRLMTPKTRKPAAGATDYLHELIAEWMLGEPLDGFSSGMMERGRFMETEAVEWYAFVRDAIPQRVGLCLRDDGLVGASPDALIGEQGILEIKCPGAKKHTSYLLGADLAARSLFAGPGRVMWITDRESVDRYRLSYHPAAKARGRNKPAASATRNLIKFARRDRGGLRTLRVSKALVKLDVPRYRRGTWPNLEDEND